MAIRHLAIERFRGIKQLDWIVGSRSPICLVGAGDSTKSTIIDAIEFALSPRWNLPFSDSDFYDSDTSEPFSITVSVNELPDELVKESRFGLHLRGWDTRKRCIRDEPEEGDECIISVRLRVPSSLEPEWTVVNKRTPEGVKISSEDRERSGAIRIDSFIDRHLSWSRGSVLARLTGKVDEMPSILADAGREARKAIRPESLTNLNAAAKEAERIVRIFGVLPTTGYAPHLDVRELAIRAGGLSLHDGSVPVRQAGLGTRRLIALSLQHEQQKNAGCVTLIDEVEHGLEPHRLRRLLRALKPGDPSTAGKQVILTTHSPVAVRELADCGVCVVTTGQGTTRVVPIVDDKIQKSLRRYPEAVLGRSILVCEGETEVGFSYALDEWWSTTGTLDPFACLGVVSIDGEGSSAVATALRFASLGFRVAVMLDSDREIPDSELRRVGVHVLLWDGRRCTESRIAEDLPWQALMHCVQLAMKNKGDAAVLSAVRDRSKDRTLGDDPDQWPESPQLRVAIGRSAKAGSWFKRIDWGENMGRAVARHLPSIPATDLAVKLESLRAWLAKQ